MLCDGAMDANGNGKHDLPQPKIGRRQPRVELDSLNPADLNFVYDDADEHCYEIEELYSYTEQYELQLNVQAFEQQMEYYKMGPWWQSMTDAQRKSVIYKLLDQLEVSNKQLRMKAARCILYLAQGCWAEVQCDTEQRDWTRRNVMLLYEAGVFPAFVELLNIEIDNGTAASYGIRKLAVSLADSVDLRVILSVMYIMTEVMREEMKSLENSIYKDQVESFKEDLMNPYGEELLIVKLLGMVTSFCSGAAPHFPMKRVLLLLWKLILVSLGGIKTLRELKKKYREEAGLDTHQEDTIEVLKTMRASSPPINATDLIENQNQAKYGSRRYTVRGTLLKQRSLELMDQTGMEFDGSEPTNDNIESNGAGCSLVFDQNNVWYKPLVFHKEGVYQDKCHNNIKQSDPVITPISSPIKAYPVNKGLPWTPKVRQKDVDSFLEMSRLKFVGFKLQGDRESLAGLPQPIHEGVNTLKKHIYTSLAEVQIQKEEEITRNPMSTPEPPIRQTPTEILYQAVLPNLPQYMISLLKILLAASPTSKAKTDSTNIMADVLPEEMPMTVFQSMKLGIDVSRHKEIIAKAVSAILLLLLKHFKLNHIYQFEFMSQHLVFANCIPLALKFLNQNIQAYIDANNVIPLLDFPSNVIGDQPELTTEDLESVCFLRGYSWRNVFTCINLLRILNKLTKWKHSRIMMLVVFKSAPILKRALKVRHAMLQLYVLKLLKMQTKYLGRQWRKSNMKTISVIYAKVRHRLNDDWAYGNDVEARPWDFQGDECQLRSCVDQFNTRRYCTNIVRDKELVPVDTCVTSVLGQHIELTEEFKQHYELWLQQEVFQRSINWDELLEPGTCEI